MEWGTEAHAYPVMNTSSASEVSAVDVCHRPGVSGSVDRGTEATKTRGRVSEKDGKATKTGGRGSDKDGRPG